MKLPKVQLLFSLGISTLIFLTSLPLLAEDHYPIYVYENFERFVRIEKIESGAQANSHPTHLPADAIKTLLGGIRLSGSFFQSKEEPVFSEEELAEIAEPLSLALAKAQAHEDVTFRSVGAHGLFGTENGIDMTSARVFIQGDKLNLIFGLIHQRKDPRSFSQPRVSVRVGSRESETVIGEELVADRGQLKQNRRDWIVLPIQQQQLVKPDSTVQKPAEGVVESSESVMNSTSKFPATAVEGRVQKIQERLEVLNQLKKNKLISEEEYSARRKAILDEI